MKFGPVSRVDAEGGPEGGPYPKLAGAAPGRE